MISPGYCPVSNAIWLSLTAIFLFSSGIIDAVDASSTCACWYGVSAVSPPSNRIFAWRTPSCLVTSVLCTIVYSLSSAISSKYAFATSDISVICIALLASTEARYSAAPLRDAQRRFPHRSISQDKSRRAVISGSLTGLEPPAFVHS